LWQKNFLSLNVSAQTAKKDFIGIWFEAVHMCLLVHQASLDRATATNSRATLPVDKIAYFLFCL